MVGQQQATASISMIGLLLGYILWSMLNTGTFVPYTSGGTPQLGNILVATMIVSIIVSALITIAFSFGATLFSVIKRRKSELTGNMLWILFIVTGVVVLLALLLHIFRVVPFLVSVLSCAIICSIVWYGKYKEKGRNKEYPSASDRGGEE